MNKYIIAALMALVAVGIVWAAQDTDLTQKEVRDPRQLEAWLEANATDAQARIGSGSVITGNIPVAAITNAAGSVGPRIGGNIPLAAITNALSPTLYSGTYTNASTLMTNVIVVLNGVIVSVTKTP